VGEPDIPFVGKANENDCNTYGADGIQDLTLKFKCREVVKAIEQLLGRKVEDGDVVPLTMTGSLLEQYGPTQILGEDMVIIKKTGEKGKGNKPDNPHKPPKKNESQETLSLSSETSGVSGFQQ